MGRKRTVSFSIDDDILAALSQYCEKERRSLSNAAEVAIVKFLEIENEGGEENARN